MYNIIPINANTAPANNTKSVTLSSILDADINSDITTAIDATAIAGAKLVLRRNKDDRNKTVAHKIANTKFIIGDKNRLLNSANTTLCCFSDGASNTD